MDTSDKMLAGHLEVPICRICKSTRGVKDAWACWNEQSGLWELEAEFDNAFCHACEEETKLDWIPASGLTSLRVRELNDAFRCRGEGNGRIFVTQGIEALGAARAAEIFTAIRQFDAFDGDNDPWGEHDFGQATIGAEKVFWKIDYYNGDLTECSANPANETETVRVLTIMLASEY